MFPALVRGLLMASANFAWLAEARIKSGSASQRTRKLPRLLSYGVIAKDQCAGCYCVLTIVVPELADWVSNAIRPRSVILRGSAKALVASSVQRPLQTKGNKFADRPVIDAVKW